MFEAIVTVAVGVIFTLIAAWIAQRVLGTPIGWLRAFIVVAFVYLVTVPVVRIALEAGDVRVDGQFQVPGAMGYLFIALALGWQFAVAVGVIMLFELFWPSGRGWHPIRTVREALRRRKRMMRYGEILRIASKHGLSLYGSHRRGEQEDVPRALVAAMNEAGPTFVKIGQVLSTRDDILPTEFTEAFATLQMQTTPMSWDDARAAIEAELARPLAEVFEWVDETPLATASLAQVHAARLLPSDGETDGASVVIKIQRPAARASVATDSDILVRLAADAERRAAWARAYGLSALAGEFVRSLNEELDYRIELKNMLLLRETLAHSSVKTMHVPDVYPELCTERMMVQERVEGVPLAKLQGGLPESMADAPPRVRTDVRSFEKGELEGVVTLTRTDPLPSARDIANSLVDAVFEQVSIRGIFHADLHPGNIILRPDGEITLIDFGSVGVLERSMRRTLIAMMAAIAAEDDIALTDLLLMVTGQTAASDDLDRVALQHDIGVILTRVRNQRSDTNIFSEVIDALRTHQLSLPPSLVLVFRTIGSLEGALRQLEPGYDMVDRALERTPHFLRMAFAPKDLVADAQLQVQLLTEQARRLPRRLETIGQRLEDGTFGVSLRMFRDPEERGWVASLVGQMTTALIGVVLIIAAVFLVVSGGGPALTPDVGLYSFLGAVVGLGGLLLVLRALRASLTRRGFGP